MTTGATFVQGVMCENERSSLRAVALETGLVIARQGGATAFDGLSFVRIMTVGAGDLAFFQRMVIRKAELATLLQMALEAGFRIFLGINDCVMRAAGLIVNAAGAVTGLTAHIESVAALGKHSRVVSGLEVFGNFLVALLAAL